MDKIQQAQIRFHTDQISKIRNVLESKKTAGEKRIWKMQMELELECTRLQGQIQAHEEKIKLLQS